MSDFAVVVKEPESMTVWVNQELISIVASDPEPMAVAIKESDPRPMVISEPQIMCVKVFEGPPGPPGPAGSDVSAPYLSGGVNAYQVVFVTDSGAVLAANAQNATHAGRIVGIAGAAALSGATVSVRRSGSVVNPAWTLEPGTRYYLQSGGEIGTNTEGLAFVQKIGIAESATSLFLQIEDPVILGGV